MHRSNIGKSLAALCLSALALACFRPDNADAAFPDHPIKIIVTSSAGGGTDIMARLVAEPMSRILKQQIIVQNEGSAGGNVGMHLLASSPADGYTLVVTSRGPWVANPYMYAKMPYDPAKDFTPISILEQHYQMFVVKAGFPAKTMAEFIAYVKAHPDEVLAGNAGVGSGAHLDEGLLNQMAGIKMKLVPYKGTGPAIIDLMGGYIDAAMSDPSSFAASLPTGKVRPLAISALKRSPRKFADLPTISEIVPGYKDVGWYGLLGPGNMPSEITHKLAEAAAQAVKDPKVSNYLRDQDAEGVGSTPEQYAAVIKSELQLYSKLVVDLGIHLE